MFITSVRDCPGRPGSPAQDRRARLPRITGLICLPRITGVMETMVPTPLPKSAIAPTVVCATPASPEDTAAAFAFLAKNPFKNKIRLRLCTLCKEHTVVPPCVRCKECNKVYNRVIFVKQRLDPSTREIWDSMPPKKKNSFVKLVHQLKGSLLRAAMFAEVRQEINAKLNLVDTATLVKILSFIFGENPISHKCPICGVKIKAYMKTCQSGFNAEESHTKKRSFEVSHGGHDSGQAESEGSPKSKSQRIRNGISQ